METGFDLQKVYKESLHFLMHDKQKIIISADEADTKSEHYTPAVNYTGDGLEPKFEADVMFSSANITSAMTSQTAEYISTDTCHEYTVKTEPIFSGELRI